MNSRSITFRSARALLLIGLSLGGLEIGRRGFATDQLRRGRQAIQATDFGPAETHLRWASRLRPESPAIRAELAMCLFSLGDAQRAGALLATIPKEALSSEQTWRVRLTRAQVSMAQGRGHEAFEALESLLQDLRVAAPFAGSKELESRILRGLGRVLDTQLGRTEAAESHLREAFEVATAANLTDERGWGLLELAAFESTHRRELTHRVANRLQPALAIFEASGHRLGRAAALDALARTAREGKDLARQAELLDQVARLYEEAGHRLGPVRLEYFRATRDSRLERYSEAYERYSRCRQRFADLGQQLSVQVTEMGLASLSLRTGRLSDARARLEALLQQLGPTPYRRYVLWLLGHVHLHAGDPQAATEAYQQVLRLDQALHPENAASLSEVLSMLGQAGLQMGDLESAERALAESRRLASEQGSVDSLVVALLSSADLAWLQISQAESDAARRRAEQAVTYLEAAIELQASHLDQALSPFYFTHFWQSLERLRALLIEWHLPDDVKARAHRALFGLLEQMRHRSRPSLNYPQGQQGPTSEAEIAALGRLTECLAERANSRCSGDRLRAAYLRYEQAVLDRPKHQRPSPDESLNRRPASLKVLQGALPPDAAIVLYAFGNDQVFALLVGPEAEVAVALPITRQELDDKVGLLLRLLSEQAAASNGGPVADRGLSADGASAAPWRPLAEALHRALIEPLYAAGLKPGMALGVVPIGALNGLPFAALCSSDGSFLIERHMVWTAPSASAMLPNGEPSGDGFVAFGVDQGVEGSKLPEAAIEARELAAELGGTAWVSDAATEAALRQRLTVRWLHIAAHGQIEPDLPRLSRLALAKPARQSSDPSTDGRLTVDEILALEVSSELVVLSSCRASASFASRGEDWAAERFGIGDAFLAAGARRVISSQLPVADSGARQLMLELYRELRSSPPAAALQRVQRRHTTDQDITWMGFGVSGSMPDRDAGPLLSVGEP